MVVRVLAGEGCGNEDNACETVFRTETSHRMWDKIGLQV